MNPRLPYSKNPKAWLGTCVSGPYPHPRSYWRPVVIGGIITLVAIVSSVVLTWGQ